jgi:MFS family permease
MKWRPKEALEEHDINKGLKLVIGDGLAAEVMTTFTGGAFLVALALLMGASNFQIGLLAALPTFTNLFQLLSIWLVRRFNNRRAVTVLSSLLARIPLVIIGILPFAGDSAVSIQLLIFFLFFHYLFGSIAGPSWNSWMKELVPENILGTYFSKRSSYTQALNVALAIMLALLLDFVRSRYPDFEINVYGIMFIIAGVIGIIGAVILSFVQEPHSTMGHENIFQLFLQPLKDGNFQRLLSFNSVWNLAVNMAIPFFTVFMMKSLGLSLSYIIGLNILSQVASIFTIRIWGRLADRYSNKTIIALSAPLYILCLIAWCFVGLYNYFYVNIILLAVIHIFMGMSMSGINLSITNLGLKLAPTKTAIVYLSARNMILSVFGSIAPLIGGRLADYFTERSLLINVEWMSPKGEKIFHLVSLHDWNFLFLIGAGAALVAVELLVHVKEVGEVDKDFVKRIMRHSIRTNLRDFFVIGTLISWHEQLWEIIKRRLLFRSP